MGMDHLDKAGRFFRDQNWSQLLRHSGLALTKLKQLKDRPIDVISDALHMKCVALGEMGQYRNQLECAQEWYCLWNTKPTDTGAIEAALFLIQSCIKNNEYSKAYRFANTLWEIINHKNDNKIPDNRHPKFLADGAYSLAQATFYFAQSEDIPPEQKQEAGADAIKLARKALEINTRLYGAESELVANSMVLLADALDCFNDVVDDEEVPRLYEQAKAIYVRVISLSVNVAICDHKLGLAYCKRANSAYAAHDLDRCVANLDLALPHFREAVRHFRAINRVDDADQAARKVIDAEEMMRLVVAKRAATTRS